MTLLEEPHDAADVEKFNNAKRKRGREDKDDLGVMEGLLAQRPGRAMIYRLLSSCHIFEANVGDPTVMAFREGERNVGLRILSLINRSAPDAFLIMMREHNNGEF